MDENQTKPNNLLDTTDCLEAVGVFRAWKNFLFLVVIGCLLVLQISFWLVDTGCVKAESKVEAAETALPEIKPPRIITPPEANELVVPLGENKTQQPVAKPSEIEELAKRAVVIAPNQPAKALQEPNQPVEAEPQPPRAGPIFVIKFKSLTWLIRLFNFVLVLAAVLYCLTMLFSVKISLLGRLGGLNHICRAFFLSLVLVVLLLPWQRFFGGIVTGVIYSPGELLDWCTAETEGLLAAALHYLRFTIYWLLAVLLLIFSQIRSMRWARAVLRRLEVI